MRKKWLSCFIICIISVSIFSVSFGKDFPDRKGSKSEPGASAGKLTFLDTLNKGKELNLAGEDVVPISAKKENASQKAQRVKSNGYRIQLMASSSEETVRAKKKSVERELKLNVYIDFDEPYYKVYVGDYTSRRSANKALSQIKQSGYPDAWIVKSKVFVDD